MKTNLKENLDKLETYKFQQQAKSIPKALLSPASLQVPQPVTLPKLPITTLDFNFSPSTAPRPSPLSKTYEWTSKLHLTNSKVFKNLSFRDKQEEVINSVLLKHDVFVCMPTGGGKSLTFQLPAVLSKGLTLVVMPLVSLIFDQITLLTNLGIQVRALNSAQSKSQQDKVYDDILYDSSVKILFVTPEKLSQSDRLNSCLSRIYSKGQLERLAVDEAHCVSQWGRDFRSDYLKLKKFRESFPNASIIALTATATERVRKDIIEVLGMRNPDCYQSSFNRPNLSYEVRPKSKKSVEEIALYIKSKHNQSGLVYCITRKDCETLSSTLNTEFNIKTGFYHADLPTETRNSIQTQWMEGVIQVLVATIAFGMGIDKKNCRFVIHYSLPKSIEGYYQESGRAGRDGLPAECILFFGYGDKIKQEFLIQKSAAGKERALIELNKVVEFCENSFLCRRKMQLEYFGEEFDSEKCRKTCDNCIKGKIGYAKDVTEVCISIGKCLQGNRAGINTLLQISAMLKGGSSKKSQITKDNECFGLLRDHPKDQIEKILRKMIQLDILKEKSVKNYKNVFNTVIELGSNFYSLISGQMRVSILNEAKKPAIHVEDSEPVEKLKDFFFEPKKKNCFALNVEQMEELKERIMLVARRLAKQQKKKIEEVVDERTLEELCETMPDKHASVPIEILNEIKYFRSNCKENIEFNFDGIDFEELDLDFKRKSEEITKANKKIKSCKKY